MRIYRSRSDEAILDWQWHEPSLRNLTHLVLKHVPAAPGRALEVGCGTGRIALALADRGYAVDGVDVNERALALAAGRARTVGAACTFRRQDFTQRGAAVPGAYDVVVCSEVLEHVEDWRALAANLHESLRPGGRLIVTVPFDPGKFSVLDEYAGHLRRFTLAEVDELLQPYRRRHVVITGFPFYRLLTRAYLLRLRITGGTHSNEQLWQKRSTRVAAAALYPLLRIDNALAFTRLGDALVAVADK